MLPNAARRMRMGSSLAQAAQKALAGLTNKRTMRSSGANQTDEAGRAAAGESFWDVWHKKNTNLNEPLTASTLAKPPERPTSTPECVSLNVYVPHETIAEGDPVNSVQIPATSGDFGIMPGHIPTVAQMRPGVLSIERDEGPPSKYFVSGGFATVHPDSSADVCAVECVPLDNIDLEACKRNLSAYEEKALSAEDEYERTAAQIGVEVCSAMRRALEG
jgi:F-type H+-transporting ATPase subunit delta